MSERNQKSTSSLISADEIQVTGTDIFVLRILRLVGICGLLVRAIVQEMHPHNVGSRSLTKSSLPLLQSNCGVRKLPL